MNWKSGKIKLLLVSLFLFWGTRAGSTAQNVFPCEGKTFSAGWLYKENTITLREEHSGSFQKTNIILSIVNGKNKQPFSLTYKTSSVKQDMRNAIFEDRENGLIVSEHLRPSEFGAIWSVELKNTGREQLWLEPGIHSALLLDKPWNLWNGSMFYPAVSKEISRSYLDDHAPSTGYLYNPATWTFPLNVFYGPKTGLALGLHPQDLTSYVGNHFLPVSESEVTFSCTSRVVLDPGQTESRRFVIIHFPSKYGYEAAIERYYKTFPLSFHPFPGVDSQILRSAGYVHWKRFDQPRRTWSGWGWCYAPFKRSGDPYGNQEDWDYTPSKCPAKYFPPSLTLEEYQQERKGWFSQGKEFDVMMMFYLNPTWAEEQLAKEKYPDTLIEDPRVDCKISGWTTGHDIEVLVYPWGNNLGEMYKKSMQQLTDNLPLDGFGFDVACPGWGRYRNFSTTISPGRAWDEKGVFADQGIAQALLMDFSRTLIKNGRPLGVVMNGGGYLGFHADCALAEAGVFSGQTLEGALHVRYFFGQKGYDLWDSYDRTGRLINYETLDAEEVREVLRSFGRYAIILALRMGAVIDFKLALGNEEAFRSLPVLTEVSEAGWWPVCPVCCDKAIWTGRTGQEIFTYLTFGNPTWNDVKSTVEIDQAEIGTADYLFSRFSGDPLELDFEEGKSRFRIQIPSYRWEVLKCRGTISPAGHLAKSMVKAAGDLHSGTLIIECSAKKKFRGTLRFRLNPGQRAISVSVNGKKIRYTQNGRIVEAGTVLSAENNLIEIQWESTVFKNSFEEISSFPFIEETESPGEFTPLATIVLPENPSHAEQLAAKRLQNYFYYWTQYRKLSVMKPDYMPEGIRIPIVTMDNKTNSKVEHAVLINTNAEPLNGILRDMKSNYIHINGRTEEQLRDNLNALLRVLDKKYPYYDKLQTGLPAFEKAGLIIKNVNQWPYLPAK